MTNASIPLGRRTGATWVAGTGAFLLVAAAATFVAVRWGDLPPSAKLAVVVGVTITALLGGASIRRTLPATGSVIAHLGAALVPVDIAAVALHVRLDEPQLLLVEGAVCSVTFLLLARWLRSDLLRWGTAVAAVALAAGVGGATSVPTALVLAPMALAASVAGLSRAAVGWSLLVALSPVLAPVEAATIPGRDLFLQLGLAGDEAARWAVVATLLAAVALGREAVRRDSADLGVIGIFAGLGGVVTSWVSNEPTYEVSLVGLAGVFLLAQVAATATRRSAFWAPVVGGVAVGAEVIAACAVAAAGLVVLFEPVLGGEVWAAEGAALAVLAAGWVVAGVRRDFAAGAWLPAAAVFAVGSVASLAPPTVTAVALTAVALGAVASRRADALCVLLAGAYAPVLAADDVTVSLVTAAAVAGALAWVAVDRSQRQPLDDDGWSLPLAVAAGAVALLTPLAHREELGLAVAIVVAALAGEALAVALDRGGRILGHAARAGTALVAGLVVGLDPAAGAAVAALLIGLAVLEATRLDEPLVALAGAAISPILVADLAVALDLRGTNVGLALAFSAVPLVGLAVVGRSRWSTPVVAAAGANLLAAIAVSAEDPAALGTTLLIAGALAVGWGLLEGRDEATAAGALLLVTGTWAHLAAADVVASEPYLAPIAALLVVIGVLSRRQAIPCGSWVAYGPAVSVLGISALAERIATGDAGHALVAGTIGVAAVAVGGAQRLLAPLVLGTGILAVLTVTETLAWTAGVPTWAWLATAGTLLLGTGVALERAGTSPLEAGQKVADVLATRFS